MAGNTPGSHGEGGTTPFLVKFPPPFQFAIIYVLGLIVRNLLPIDIVPESLTPAAHIIGLFLVGLGLLLAVASAAVFIHRGTTLIPHGAPMHLIDVGPFLISRNPMYVSLTLVYAGAAVWQVAIWPLILLPIPIATINRIVIPFEEKRLHEIFGASYDEYCRRVRRWL
jgi:protein-S-isoprenylcysteine O-methyltransferase Ste14